MAAFGQSEQRKSSVLFPIQSEKSPDSGFFTCDPTKKSVAKCRGSWVVGRGRGSWVWVVGVGVGKCRG